MIRAGLGPRYRFAAMVPRDLLITTFVPRLGTGRDLHTYATARALAAHRPLDIAWVPYGGDEPSPEFKAIEGTTFHQISPSRALRRGVGYALRRAEGVPNPIARSFSPEIAAVTRHLASTPDRGRVIAGDINAMTALLGLARKRPIIYRAHNLESSYRDDPYDAAFGWRPISVLERRLLARAEETWMVSHLDIEQGAELQPAARMRYVPNVVDVGAITPARRDPSARTVLMVGDFSYGPNRNGLHILVEEVMPKVWATLPSAKVRVVGRGLPAGTFSDTRVETPGYVERLSDAYDDASVVAVPLTESVGTPLKFIEAMAYGVPVVATPAAALRLAVVPGEHYRRGVDTDSFAMELVALLKDGDPEMAQNARALAEREYSIETLTRLLAP